VAVMQMLVDQFVHNEAFFQISGEVVNKTNQAQLHRHDV
jgi:hypothetical protein